MMNEAKKVEEMTVNEFRHFVRQQKDKILESISHIQFEVPGCVEMSGVHISLVDATEFFGTGNRIYRPIDASVDALLKIDGEI